MERITIEEASKILGISKQSLRVLMQRGTLDIGIAVPPQEGGERWNYIIYREKVNRLVGKN